MPGADERIPDLVPFPLTGDENDPPEPQPLLLYGEGRDVSQTYAVRGGGGTYRWGFRAPVVRGRGDQPRRPVADRISASRVGTVDSSIGFAVPPDGTAKEVSMVLDGMPRSPRTKQFLIDRLTVGVKQRIGARLRDGGRELLLENSGGDTTVRVRVRAEPGAAPTAGRAGAAGRGQGHPGPPGDVGPGPGRHRPVAGRGPRHRGRAARPLLRRVTARRAAAGVPPSAGPTRGPGSVQGRELRRERAVGQHAEPAGGPGQGTVQVVAAAGGPARIPAGSTTSTESNSSPLAAPDGEHHHRVGEVLVGGDTEGRARPRRPGRPARSPRPGRPRPPPAPP